MTADEYFRSTGVSNTMLGHLDQSPAHLQAYLAQPPETTKGQEIGTFFHELTLLENAPKNIAIKPEGMSFAKIDGKAWKKEALAAGKTILTQDEYDSIYGMRDAIMREPRLKLAIETGQREVALFAPFIRGSVTRKARLDLIPESIALIDLKSTLDASPRVFGKQMAANGYIRQAAYYLDIADANGLPQTQFLFVAVEKSRPYAMAMYYLTPEQINAGRGHYVRLLQRYMECAEKNEWPAYGDREQPAQVPEWYLRGELEAITPTGETLYERIKQEEFGQLALSERSAA